MSIGDIANNQGDIRLFLGSRPVAEGRFALPVRQALRALPFGWRWLGTHDMSDGPWIVIQRGGERLAGRQ